MSISASLHCLLGDKMSRRFWLTQIGALGLGTAACNLGSETAKTVEEKTAESGSELKLTLACVDNYDRTRALLDGSVKARGIQLQAVNVPGGDLFRRVAQQSEFDVAEMSTSTYMAMKSRGDERYIGIPAFPSRNFRHAYMFVNRRSAITRPEDLAGKRVGIFEYQMTAGLVQRAFLQDDYGVRAQQIEWFEGGINEPDNPERYHIEMPADIQLRRIGKGETLSRLLEDGKLDAMIGAGEPECFERASHIGRLFPDYRSVEKDYYKRTGFFPIMHMVVIRRVVYEAHPWVAQSIFEVFQSAKASGLKRLGDTGVLACALPWLLSDLEEIKEVFGEDHWPYGISKNRALLERMTQASVEQGLSARKLEVQKMFAEETLQT